MASFGLSEGAPWGSEGSRSRRKRPYFSPSPPYDEEEEEEEEEGRRGRSRPGCWDPPRGGGGRSRSPPRRKRERRRSGGSSSRAPSRRHPDPRRTRPGKAFFSPSPSPSSGGGSRERGRGRRRERGSPRAESPHGSPWEPAPKRTPRWRSPGGEGEDALGQRRRMMMMMEGSPSQRSSSSYRSKGVPGWEARQDQDHQEREVYPRREGRSGERRRASDQGEGSYGEEEGVWEKPSSSRSKGVPGWEAKQDQDCLEREAYPKKGVQRGSDEREGSHGEWVGGRARPSSSRSKRGSGWEAKQDQDHREREAYPWREGRSGERRGGSGQREGSYGEEEGVWEKPSNSRSKGASGWEAKQDQDHREREAYPRREGRSGERQSGFYQREGSYDGREGGQSSPRSTRRSEWEASQDQDYRERIAYPKKAARRGETQRGTETMEGGFLSYARGEEGWSSPGRRREQGGPSWGDPKWNKGREDSPRYRDQSHFDSDLRGIDWDSPELKRREYERPTTSGKGQEMRHRSSEDLEDCYSSTGYLEEWSLQEDQEVRKTLQGYSSGPEGRPKINVGPDEHTVAPWNRVPRKEVVDYWHQCQSVMHRNVQNDFLSICPRPTLPYKSGEPPVLNPSVEALMTAEQVRDYTFCSYFLRFIHEEVLNMLGPVMTVYEMAEESIEKQEAVDPRELRQWARRIVRYMGSLNQRLKLQRCSEILGAINPRLKRMTTQLSGRSEDGLLFAKNKVKLLQDLIQSFPELGNQKRDQKVRNEGDQKHGSKKFASHAREGAAVLHEQISAPQSFAAAAGPQREEAVSLDLWHRRFAHRDEKGILALQDRSLAVGVRINQTDVRSTAKCAVCLRIKGPRPSSLPATERASTQVLDLIHGVLHGPLPEPSLKNDRYALIFVDDFSRYCCTYLLKGKHEVQEVLQKYINLLRQLFQRAPKAFQMENGIESVSDSSKVFLEEHGVLYRWLGRHTSDEKGAAVREMTTLFEMTQCMLADAGLPKKFWGEAFMMATHLLNRFPGEGSSKTPFELWHGQVPQMKHLRVFGSVAYAFREGRQTLRSATEQTVLLGYVRRDKWYKVMSVETGHVEIREVHYFVEEKTANAKGTAPDPLGAQKRSGDPLLSATASTPSRLVSDRT